MNSETDIHGTNGQVVGAIITYGDSSGPCIYGDVPVVVSADSPAYLRIFGAISSRESPMRSKGNPKKPSFEPVGAINGVQAYEKHGASAGAVHWISVNGNLQRMLKKLCDAVPQVGEYLYASGYSFSGDKMCSAASGDPLTTDEYRSSEFCVFLYELLGAHFLSGEADEAEIAGVRAGITQVQCSEAWKLITDRDALLKKHGFFEATYADERLRMVTASISINCGVKLMESMLADTEDKTAKALTEARVRRYDSVKSGFGRSRSLWELNCGNINDGVPFNLDL